MKKQYRDFESARKVTRSLNLKGWKEWVVYCKSGNKPENIPSHPERVYPKEFKKKGKWGYWLGTGTIVFLSFKKARKFVRELKLKNTSAWNEYRKSEDKPNNIPSTPNTVYKNDGWISIPDWLGNGNSSNTLRDYLSYQQCSKLIQKNNITTREQLKEYRESCKRPDIIPGHPWDVYKKQGTWISWGNFTGTDKEANQHRKFKSYKDARSFTISLNLKTQSAWKKYWRINKIPKDIPVAPDIFYKKQGTWISWGDFLGTGTVANQNKQYLPFKDAKIKAIELAKKYNIKSPRDWEKAVKEGKIPSNIPRDPKRIYSKRSKR